MKICLNCQANATLYRLGIEKYKSVEICSINRVLGMTNSVSSWGQIYINKCLDKSSIWIKYKIINLTSSSLIKAK